MTSAPQLFPREPRRMKQPTKAILREHLELAASEIERLNRIVVAVEDALKPRRGEGYFPEVALRIASTAPRDDFPDPNFPDARTARDAEYYEESFP